MVVLLLVAGVLQCFRISFFLSKAVLHEVTHLLIVARRLLEIVAAFTAIWYNTSSLKDTIVVDVDAVASSMIEVARREKFSCTKREKK